MTERELNEAQLKLAQKDSELKHKRFRFEVLAMAQEATKEVTVPNGYKNDPDKALVVAKKYMDFISEGNNDTPPLKLTIS